MTARPTSGQIQIPATITVKELGELLDVSAIEVIKRLMTKGVMANLTQSIDYDTASGIAAELGHEAQREEAPAPSGVLPAAADDEEIVDDPATLRLRPPVVTILGHVDHGKTSLLDRIRKTRVAAGEAGGITQHIGAYQVERDGKQITFIDTPGHAAFTAMRARGAQVTDIAVLVVAANDGVMPQTIEAINHALAANVPIIVAINKIDLPAANPDRVKQQLTEHNIVVEDYGGDIVSVPVSATTGEGIDDLLEAINLVAEISELRANPDRPAAAVVIEAELDSSRGPVATMLVQAGTLHQGDALVGSETSGKVKAMFDYRGERVREAGPSTPVVVMGLESVPEAGERFRTVVDERTARAMVESRRRAREADETLGRTHVNLDTLFTEINAGKLKELVLILKADVRGSAEAIRAALDRLPSPQVQLRLIHSATGPVSDSDVMLAEASNGIIIAFNTRVEASARKRADASGVEIRSYSIIYQLLEDVEKALVGMLEPVFQTVVDGHAEVRQVFKSSRLGQIAGCFVTDGVIRRGSTTRILRNKEEVGRARCEGLKRFQDDVREVQTGYECGVVLSGFEKFAEGDVIEFFHEERVS